VGGVLPRIEVYDDELMKPLAVLEEGCHRNKIFAVKFNPIYANQLMSGGWDN
jgi:hypothetical protein